MKKNYQLLVDGQEIDTFVVNSKDESDAATVLKEMGGYEPGTYSLIEREFVFPEMFTNCIMDKKSINSFLTQQKQNHVKEI
jgi:hypothetical protein